jgi:hypothetical protein
MRTALRRKTTEGKTVRYGFIWMTKAQSLRVNSRNGGLSTKQVEGGGENNSCRASRHGKTDKTPGTEWNPSGHFFHTHLATNSSRNSRDDQVSGQVMTLMSSHATDTTTPETAETKRSTLTAEYQKDGLCRIL